MVAEELHDVEARDFVESGGISLDRARAETVGQVRAASDTDYVAVTMEQVRF